MRELTKGEVARRRADLKHFAQTGEMSPELRASSDAFTARNREAFKGALRLLTDPEEIKKLNW